LQRGILLRNYLETKCSLDRGINCYRVCRWLLVTAEISCIMCVKSLYSRLWIDCTIPQIIIIVVYMYVLLFNILLFYNVCFVFEPSVADSSIPKNFFFYSRVFCFNTVFTEARPWITSRTSWMLYIHNVLKSYLNIIILFAVKCSRCIYPTNFFYEVFKLLCSLRFANCILLNVIALVVFGDKYRTVVCGAVPFCLL
jgi:hypothetical protein